MFAECSTINLLHQLGVRCSKHLSVSSFGISGLLSFHQTRIQLYATSIK